MRFCALILATSLLLAGACGGKKKSGPASKARPAGSDERLMVLLEAPGLTALEQEARITRPTEQALMELPGILTVQSASRPGSSRVAVQLSRGVAWRESLARLARTLDKKLISRLPATADKPLVWRITPPGHRISLMLTNKKVPLEALAATFEKHLRPALLAQPEVRGLDVRGAPAPEVEVLVKAGRAAAFGLTLSILRAALQQAGQRSIQSLGDLEMLVIGGASVRLKQVAGLRLEQTFPQGHCRARGQPAICIDVRLRGRQASPKLMSALEQLAANPRLPGSQLHWKKPRNGPRVRSPQLRTPRAVLDFVQKVEQALGPSPTATGWQLRWPALDRRSLPEQRVEVQVTGQGAWRRLRDAIPRLAMDAKALPGDRRRATGLLLCAKDRDLLRRATTKVVTAIGDAPHLITEVEGLAQGATIRVEPAKQLPGNLAKITTSWIIRQLRLRLVGVEVLRLQQGRRSLPVRLRLDAVNRSELNALREERLPLDDGSQARLADIATLEEVYEPTLIIRHNRRRCARIYLWAPGQTAGSHRALSAAERSQHAPKNLPPGLHWTWQDAGDFMPLGAR